MFEKYRDYFDIDPEYFPTVNEEIIEKNPEIWKKYYPHETFVKLIKDTIHVLSRQQKLSIWVEGAYGTGKSHAVLTLKKLLDASEEDTRAYFQKYPDQLSDDLFKQFQRAKSDDRKIITVHRYGSSNIDGDNALVFALQESIENALKENGIEYNGETALKEAVIKWLSQPWAKEAFNRLVKEKYATLFGGDDADAVIEKLRTYKGDALITLMNKVTKVGDENRFAALSLDVNGLLEWIKDIIKENHLKAIVFIWDEFTNYFEKNLKSLTGFQQIVELSATEPFYMIIVTHKSSALFSDNDPDHKRIMDRFVKPTCNIDIPDNMAFRLMGSAMVKSENEAVLDDWNDTVDELYDRTLDSRKFVRKTANISDKELQNILPIHPYAALVLKHISSAFDSNQRSMFDFIKNDRGDEIKGFQWFIDNYGPQDENPFLTVDLLWDFFYEKGKEYLSYDIRSILDCYPRALTKQLTSDEKRVLKAVLLMEAISHRAGSRVGQNAGDIVQLFIPDDQNIDNAFDGSDLESGAARRIAEKLCKEEILYRKFLGGNKYQYSAMVNAGDMSVIEKTKEELIKKSTSALINEGDIMEAITLTGPLKLRYHLEVTSYKELRTTANILRSKQETKPGVIATVFAVAKDDNESASISKTIDAIMKDDQYDIVFIDASLTPIGQDILGQYAEAMANAKYQRGKDNSLANQYEQNAKDTLKKWKNNISNGEFIISYKNGDEIRKERVSTVDQLYILLADITRKRFPYSLETIGNVIDNMWTASSLKSGVEYGAKQDISKGTYASGNAKTKLDHYIGKEAWQQAEGSVPYWTAHAHLPISKIKQCVEDTIQESFQSEGRVSIQRIYDALKEKPFGFLPCNLTAFVLGFVLKEYVNGEYTWSDSIQNEPLTILKLKEMVSEVIALQNTQNSKYRDKYIVMLTEEEKAFNEASSKIFNIPLNQCANVEQTRERIRNEMKKLSFPVWSLKYLKSTSERKTEKKDIDRLIDLYGGIANSQNISGGKTDNDIALEIGKLCMKKSDLIDDAALIFTKEKCTEGMVDYLADFDEGILPELAKEIGDNGQYINALKSKFDADAANWVWNQETAQTKIREVILEYKIIYESNKINSKTVSFKSAITEWCDKSKYIRISFQSAKHYLGDLKEFLQLLCDLKKAGVLLDSQKQKFYDALVRSGSDFREFYANPIDVFKKVCEFYISAYGFTEEEINEFYKMLPVDCLTKEKSEYENLINDKAKEFDSARSSAKLRKLWYEKTHTKSPKEWSKQYMMPILCMVRDDEILDAKNAFAAFNHSNVDSSVTDKALAFLESDDLFERLESTEERDRAFRTNIIKQYAIMLTDIDEVKEYLNRSTEIGVEPYEWYGHPKIDEKLCKMAEVKYNQYGCDRALEKIDSMEIGEVKHYLKELIKDNMIVGMEIIKED